VSALGNLLAIILLAVLVDNFVLIRFFGICPFLGVSKKVDTSLGMGMAVIFVMTLASLVTWLIFEFLLVPFEIQYLRTVSFILVIAALVQLVEMIIQKVSPALNQALGIFLPLITTNCAVLAVAILNVQNEFSLLEAVVYGFGAAIGFTLALLLIAGMRERLELVTVPKPFQGTAIALITAGILSIAFMGFRGMISL
jgi:Na+-translocating ferredoxin:NAD+ oxidoreductase subunit A